MEYIWMFLCFIFGLLFLITIHEFGHFIAAKIFNVYCFEFSICFGKKILRKKKRYAETYFCIGIIPLGGYVSMYGEDDDDTKEKRKEEVGSLNQELTSPKSETTISEEKPQQTVSSTFTVIERKVYKQYKKQQRLLKKGLSCEQVLEKLGLEKLIIEEDFYSEVDEEHLPTKRDLEHINRGKKFIIMAAGITMNFIIGYVLYLVALSCFPANAITLNLSVTPDAVVEPNSLAYDLNQLNESVADNGQTYIMEGEYAIFVDNIYNNKFISNFAVATADVKFKDHDESYHSLMVPNNYFTSLSNVSFDDQMYVIDKENNIYYNFYEIKCEAGEENWLSFINSPTFQEKIKESPAKETIEKMLAAEKIEKPVEEMTEEEKEEMSFYNLKNNLFAIKVINSVCLQKTETLSAKTLESATLNIPMIKATINEDSPEGYFVDKEDLDNKNIDGTLTYIEESKKLSSTQLNYVVHEYWLGEKSFAQAGQEWAKGTTAVFEAVGGLIVGKGWDQIGGPIAIFTQSANILKNNPFSIYVKMWGLISVNLAVMNLLPIPGLDGWHLLVTIIESITRKKLNPKFKKWASLIGMGCLFALMAVVVVLDLVKCATGGF